ncbi:MAG: hypothetical protein IID44_25125 [Planctomycetes bacterium]|nr:hypothetical protein [Planctomycetota bacterium]
MAPFAANKFSLNTEIHGMSIPARAFVAALLLAAAGGVAFGVGVAAAFGRAGNWSNDLALLGIVLLVSAVLSNILACAGGAIHLFRHRRMQWWWPLSVVAMLASLYAAWVALHL